MTSRAWISSICTAAAQLINESYPLRHDVSVKKLAYGTAGFRTEGTLLVPVAARVIFIAVLRAMWCTKKKQDASIAASIGFMITASHNPFIDNGFKIIDTDAGMLASDWEGWCALAANAVTGEDLAEVIARCIESTGLELTAASDVKRIGAILLGRDTRATGAEIASAVHDVLSNVLDVAYIDYGILTTPELHYLVLRANTDMLVKDMPAEVGTDLYHADILSNFAYLMEQAVARKAPQPAHQHRRVLVIDAANGVGAIGLRRLIEFSSSKDKNASIGGDILGKYFDIRIVNDNINDASMLNTACGAEYAKSNQKPSVGMNDWTSTAKEEEKATAHYYCLDGDADRLVAFSYSGDNNAASSWHLLDGDRISILYAMLLCELLGSDVLGALDVGIVQTGYANGASTAYVTDTLQMHSFMAATGVKHLHPVAHARAIGVYFEANGHGTVLFNSLKCEAALLPLPTEIRERISRMIYSMSHVVSQACGDAIGDMLMCEVALAALDLSFEDWLALYTDRPSLQRKVSVPDPCVIINTPDETRALAPVGLQEGIDAAVADVVAKCGGAARSFIRPSGTEPIVRLYAEATTKEDCVALVTAVENLVREFCSQKAV